MPELEHLLRTSVDDVDVPHPDLATITARGRRQRSRRRAAAGAVAVIAVLAVTAGALGVARLDADPRGGDRDRVAGKDAEVPPKASDPAAALAAYYAKGAWTTGDEVHVGDATVRAVSAQNLVQTSVGAVAKVGDTGTWQLLRPDGSVDDLGISGEPYFLTADPNAPTVAWAAWEDAALVLHVRDVDADRSLADVDITPSGATDPKDGMPIQVQLDGSAAYVVVSGVGGVRVDWRTGGSERLTYEPVSVRGGIAVAARDQGGPALIDTRTGRVLRTLDAAQEVTLSPDGRQLLVTDLDADPSPIAVESVTSARPATLPGADIARAWTPGGSVIASERGGTGLVRCAVSSGTPRCETVDGGGDAVAQPADYIMAG